MSSETESIVVDQIKRIISINNGLTNFKARIYLKSKNPNEQFKVAIMTMDRLETTTHIPYQHIVDSVLFNLVNDNGHYKDYVIVIKADTVIPVYLNMSVKSIMFGQGHITENFKALDREDQGTINEFMDPNKYFQGDIAKCPPGKETDQMYGSASTNTETKKCEIKYGASPNDIAIDDPVICNKPPKAQSSYEVDYTATEGETVSIFKNSYFVIGLVMLVIGLFMYLIMGSSQNGPTTCRLNM